MNTYVKNGLLAVAAVLVFVAVANTVGFVKSIVLKIPGGQVFIAG
ncbi:MAG TPA: hypothetical protein VFC07_00990 [Verrucomicrobiae bacterium]|nr:hypothetical protein [Verrucomicrobiae bacterium]